MRRHLLSSAVLGSLLATWSASSVCRAEDVQASAPQPWVTQASVVGYRGVIEIEAAGKSGTQGVSSLPVLLSPGDKVHTATSGEATIQFRDGSKLTLGAGSTFSVEEERAERISLHLFLGKVWCAVSKLDRRHFRVRTPTAVASVRGTEFSVEALAAGRTAVEVFGGLVSVRGSLGDEALVGANRRVDVIEGRMGAVERFEARPDPRMPQSGPASGVEGRRDGSRREQGGPGDKQRFGFDPGMFKEFVSNQADEQARRDGIESGAAFDQKAQLYQEGKTLIDAFGRRVRVEEYIKRPTPDSFKFVSFNFRENRTDIASVEVKANAALPERLADAGNLWFSPGATAPAYYAVKQKLTMSNGADSVVQLGVDGAPQSFTVPGAPIFDPGSNSFISSPGGGFFGTMFGNKYEFINGNGAAIADIFSGAFRPVNNGDVSGAGNTASGMMWRTQPVKVNITDGATSLGAYWTDAFVKYDATNGLAYAQSTFQPTPGAAHFISQRSYYNFTDDSNGGGGNGILDFGEALDPNNPTFYHDIVERINGANPAAAMPGAGARQAIGDTVVFTDPNRNNLNDDGAAAQHAISYVGSPVQDVQSFVKTAPRDWLAADEFAIDDFGKVLPAGGDFTGSGPQFSGMNFERRLRSSRFTQGDIDVVMSPSFIFQSGVSNASNQGRAVPSPGPKQ